ncbi:methyltransferase [Desulfurococcus amylolyticus 1221n]|uniref:Methyltransferase n=1 Tax=Desulfurococcus amylolyticus (strain DSM 18924 / JCM 16383 / VKM B-2413 / 1221n) TaxID=490899 RepID=B8D3H3_DESA1|nr:class I SAM-dependent methyltransferase family protein [Desulfurococcus amylolyticus]ACL10654.1 methyltransferase [Desulfurococcus amylolyticus 1221n]
MTRGSLLKELAREILGEGVAEKVWRRVEFIGDLALIRTPLDMSPEELKPLALEILKRFNFVKSVWAAIPGVEGPYRLRKHVLLAGEDRSETLYREHGCIFKVDINKVYISPSLNYEHYRIAKLVAPGETVLNMFAGAGLFSIIIARYAKPRKVYSIDINPYAYHYMVENVRLNHVEDVVEPILGDAGEVVNSRLTNTSDRVLMPYPELALDYLDKTLMALRDGRGWIHVYLHVKTAKGEHYLTKAEQLVAEKLASLGVRNYDISSKRKIRNVGPRTHQVVVDIKIL